MLTQRMRMRSAGIGLMAALATCVSATPCVLFIAFEGPVDVQTGDRAP